MTFPPVPGADQYLIGLKLRAATPAAGFLLQNGTPNILTWTPPNDGRLHRFIPIVIVHVITAETGGNINIAWTTPDGAAFSATPFFGGAAAGIYQSNSLLPAVVGGGFAVTLSQSSALTAGVATVFAELWGS